MKQAAFHDPGWLLLFLVFPVLLWLHVRYWRRRQPLLTLASLPGQLQATRQLITPPDVLFALRLLSLAGIVLALANVQTATVSKQKVAAQGIDLVLAMDISASMQIEDIKPNRLEGLKTVISRFVAGRTDDRLGLVVYAGESLNWCPLTKDYGFLLRQLNQLDQPTLADGTAIGLGLASAVNALRTSQAKSKVIILLTDGENNTGFIEPVTAAQLARKHRIKVYTIGIGTTGTAPLPLYDLNGRKTYHYVPVKIDEPALRSIAQQTGGKFFRAKDAATLRRIYAEIDGMEQSPTGYRTQVQHTAQYRWFLGAALFFFVLGEGLLLTVLRSLG
ncbi:VWA domain-containing protein [Hymenobacter sp. 5317J-9]|uniref:VWA domain-containing protein n=1 Tax=Hymenobacter sp. 5317J-9 TaxID=2932250 RepID=UPI001FD67612|nr:VWA domain-containing protein [Hymenobacter sp. 5317J-9]UOQ96709.1 VWA domain-containing protein [Hymenobacter sp. 5317J-9]